MTERLIDQLASQFLFPDYCIDQVISIIFEYFSLKLNFNTIQATTLKREASACFQPRARTDHHWLVPLYNMTIFLFH